MKTIIALTVLAALAATQLGSPLLTIAVLLLASATFAARALAAWPGAAAMPQWNGAPAQAGA